MHYLDGFCIQSKSAHSFLKPTYYKLANKKSVKSDRTESPSPLTLCSSYAE